MCKDCIRDLANKRQLAFGVDVAVAVLPLIVFVAVLGAERVDRSEALTTAAFALLVPGAAYLLLKDGFAGRSLGKLLLGLRVVDAHTGLPATVPQSVKRNLVLPVLFVVPFGPPVASRKAPRFGEEWAGTRVTPTRLSKASSFVPALQ